MQGFLAAFVFFKTRYAAVVGSQLLQSSNPMLWVTDLAPEPYRQLWLRQITVLLASVKYHLSILMFSLLEKKIKHF